MFGAASAGTPAACGGLGPSEGGASCGRLDPRLRGGNDRLIGGSEGDTFFRRPDPAAPTPGVRSTTFDFLQDSIAKGPVPRNAEAAGTMTPMPGTMTPMQRRARSRGART